MKKVFIMAGIVLLAGAVKAQHISLGPTASFGHASSSYDYQGLDKKFYPAYNFGMSLIYSTNTNWGFGADVKYAGEGAKYEGKVSVLNTSVNGELKTRLNYLRVPLKVIRFFGDYGKAVHPKISLGPSFGFLLDGETETRYSNTVTKREAKDDFKGFDFGVQGIVGVNFRLAPSVWLNTDIAYYHGITDAVKDNSREGRNYDVGVNIGLMFGIGGK